MKTILVPIKRVPDYEAKLKLLDDGSGVDTGAVKAIVNPFDEIAVEEAVRIKEKFRGKEEVEVVIATIGPAAATEQIRAMIALGADRGIHIVPSNPVDSKLVDSKSVDSALAASLLTKLVQRDNFTLVIMGKQAIDSDASQTAPLLASALRIPCASFASQVELSDDWQTASVVREVDGGLETVRIRLPAVISTDLRLNTPRFAPLPGILRAKKAPIENLTFDMLGVGEQLSVKTISMSLPPKRQAGKKVSTVAELVEKLRDEARVL